MLPHRIIFAILALLFSAGCAGDGKPRDTAITGGASAPAAPAPASDQAYLTHRVTTSPGQSLLELALTGGTDTWTLAGLNGLAGSWDGLPGDSLYTAGPGSNEQLPTGLPPAFRSAEIPSLPLQQGSTAEILVSPVDGVSLAGMLGDYPLHFFPVGDGRMVALQGIHAMLEPGVYPLQLDATLSNGTVQSFQQLLVISDAAFPKESLTVPAESIDPAITAPEEEFVRGIVSSVSDTKRWNGVLALPVTEPFCVKDWFGTRRSFNLSDYDYFHAGLDYGLCYEVQNLFDIYAAAPGVVAFSGPLNVRGNATVHDIPAALRRDQQDQVLAPWPPGTSSTLPTRTS